MKLFSKETIKRAVKFFGDLFEPNPNKRDLAIELINEKHYKAMIDEVLSIEDLTLEEKYLLMDGEVCINE